MAKATRPSKAVNTQVVLFKIQNDKETPGAYRYAEVAPEGAKADDMLVGSLYVRKAKAPKKSEELEVSITFK